MSSFPDKKVNLSSVKGYPSSYLGVTLSDNWCWSLNNKKATDNTAFEVKQMKKLGLDDAGKEFVNFVA